MGYHSADYNHDWKIGVAELARVTTLASTTNLGITTGCYKVDDTSIDGFAPDNTRAIGDPVTLTKYHSADYNQDGRIDANELARVTELYNYQYQDLPSGSYVRTGQYHSDDPLSIDGFGLGPVYLSAYAFDTDHKPIIYTNTIPGNGYILRAKFVDGSPTDFQSTTTKQNNGLVLDVLPPPGVYHVDLYYVRYAVNGFEGDYNNDGLVTQEDVDAIGGIATGILPQPTGSQFMRADCAPIATLGNGGPIDAGDWVQAARYKNGLDAYNEAGGPGTPDVPPTYIAWQISDACRALVTVSAPSASTERCALSNCICGDLSQEEEEATDPDKGQCFPYREKRSCNVPTVPVAECVDTQAYPIFTPGATPPFYVVSRLFDSLCEPITDQDNNTILTIIK